MSKIINPWSNYTFYQDKNGNIRIRAKRGPIRNWKTAPEYERVRRHSANFGAAATAGKFIRDTFRFFTRNMADPSLTARMQKTCMAGIRVGEGFRQQKLGVTCDDPSVFNLFQFNPKCTLENAFFRAGLCRMEIGLHQVQFHLPAFIPSQHITGPKGNDIHFRLRPFIAAFDLEAGNSWMVQEKELVSPVPINDIPQSGRCLQSAVSFKTGVTLFFVLGVEFFHREGLDSWSPVAGGTRNALGILQAVKLHIP